MDHFNHQWNCFDPIPLCNSPFHAFWPGPLFRFWDSRAFTVEEQHRAKSYVLETVEMDAI
jgi:hypothetical protein